MSKTLLGYADYSHVEGFSDYMQLTIDYINSVGQNLKVLDVPAGNGKVVERLIELGHDAVGGDINSAREHFVRVNMEQPFPFDDETFDVVTCLEGIEHVISGYALLKELVRIVKPGGTIIITTPNVMNLYSRLWYFLYGYPYQFPPHANQQVKDGEEKDRGHINPMSYLRLRYLLESLGATITSLQGDRIKKKHLIPFLYPIYCFCWLMSAKHRKRQDGCKNTMSSISKHLRTKPLLLSRSILIAAQKS